VQLSLTCRFVGLTTCSTGPAAAGLLSRVRRRQRAGQRSLVVGHHQAGVLASSMIDWSTCPAAERDPDRVSGAWVFRGTRVPLSALFENLEDGVPPTEFVKLVPGVSLDQVRTVLEHAARSALAPA
jgi:uncharacterized protein (DUF433 family)